MNADKRQVSAAADNHSAGFAASVADYYNFNTPKFLPGGKRRSRGSIHRKLFPPGVRNSEHAENYSHQLILGDIVTKKPERILDLGCGIGGTIRYLQESYTADYTGITLSTVQSRMARDLGTNVHTADFLDGSWYESQKQFDYMYAIESLQHNPDHPRLGKHLADHSSAGATLAVIDDFLLGSGKKQNTNSAHRSLIQQFVDHWYAKGYTFLEDYLSLMNDEGFSCIEIRDLTSYMRPHHLRTALASALVSFLRLRKKQSPWTDNLIGGTALKRLQNRGVSGYFFIRFEKRGTKHG